MPGRVCSERAVLICLLNTFDLNRLERLTCGCRLRPARCPHCRKPVAQRMGHSPTDPSSAPIAAGRMWRETGRNRWSVGATKGCSTFRGRARHAKPAPRRCSRGRSGSIAAPVEDVAPTRLAPLMCRQRATQAPPMCGSRAARMPAAYVPVLSDFPPNLPNVQQICPTLSEHWPNLDRVGRWWAGLR